MRAPAILRMNQHISFTHSKDTVGVSEYKRGHVTLSTPSSVVDCHPRPEIATINLPTKFKFLSPSVNLRTYENMKSDTKFRKCGGLG